jgi:hypothetical protein
MAAKSTLILTRAGTEILTRTVQPLAAENHCVTTEAHNNLTTPIEASIVGLLFKFGT